MSTRTGSIRTSSGMAAACSADAQPMHGFAYSAALTLPANSVLVFAR